MISKDIVKKFIERKIFNHSFVKTFSRKELLKEIKPHTKEVNFKFKTKPFKHQLACFFIGIFRDRFLFLLDMGLGKTKIVLDILTFKILNGEIKKPVLVLVPSFVNIEGWGEEILIHSNLKFVSLLGNSKEKLDLINKNTDTNIFILNYMGLIRMLSDFNKGKKSITYDEYGFIEEEIFSKGNLKLNVNKVKKFSKNFDGLILDESHSAKNKKTLTFRICNYVAKQSKILYLLTGTPFGTNPVDLWSQFYLVDKGYTLGESKGLFQQAFFKEVPNQWTGFSKYVFDDEKRKDLFKRIKNVSIRFKDTECSDVPKALEIKSLYNLYGENLKYYEEGIKEFLDIDGVDDYKRRKNSFIKLREICSGFFYIKRDDGKNKSSKKDVFYFKNNPKLQLAEELILQIPIKRSFIIFYEFNPSGLMLFDLLKKLKIDFSMIGGVKKDPIKQIKDFKNGNNRCLLANWKSTAAGGNFQIANYTLFYESPVSPIYRKQCIKRTNRTKQKRKTFYYDLVFSKEDSVENKILDSIKTGEDLFSSVIEGKKIFRKTLL